MIVCSHPPHEEIARQLSLQHGLSVSDSAIDSPHIEIQQEKVRLQLNQADPLVLNLTLPRLHHRLERYQHELLIKAFKSKSHTINHIVDATAGMGTDGLLLAAAGFQVTLIEQNLLLLVALEAAITIASATEPTIAKLRPKLKFIHGNSIDLLPNMPEIDAIYLDPMFNPVDKKRLGPGSMQGLQKTNQADSPALNETALLKTAIDCAAHWVALKRPIKAPLIEGFKLHSQLKGKTIRIDRYLGSKSL